MPPQLPQPLPLSMPPPLPVSAPPELLMQQQQQQQQHYHNQNGTNAAQNQRPPGFPGAPFSQPQLQPQPQPQPAHPAPRELRELPAGPADLLSLLKRSSASASPAAPPAPSEQMQQSTSAPASAPALAPAPASTTAASSSTASSATRAFSAQDLLATLYGRKPEQAAASAAAPAAKSPSVADHASNASPEMLLKLFNTPKPAPAPAPVPASTSATIAAPAVTTAAAATIAGGVAPSPAAVAPAMENGEPTDTESGIVEIIETIEEEEGVEGHSSGSSGDKPSSEQVNHSKESSSDSASSAIAAVKTLFNYVNPFDQLAAVAAKEKKQASAQTSPVASVNGHAHAAASASSLVGQTTAAPAPAPAPASAPASASTSASTSAQNDATAAPASKSVATPVAIPVIPFTPALEAAHEAEKHASSSSDMDAVTTIRPAGSSRPVKAIGNESSAESKDAPAAAAAGTHPMSSSLNEDSPTPTRAATMQKRGPPSEVPSHWEPEHDADAAVPVHNFPYRPFLVITWKGTNPGSTPTVRPNSVLDIARLKKEFEQLDRQLISATSDFVAYPSAKTGVRVIRQSDGADVHLFKLPVDRIIHVNLCSTSAVLAPTHTQNLLAVGASGTTYWAPISSDSIGPNQFSREDLDAKTLVFPPSPLADENPSGGQNPLRTRARRSSRHPEFCGIMRGRYVHIVFPAAAIKTDAYLAEPGTPGSRKIDTARFYKEQCFKIPTGGKPGRDFAFSDDDTTVITLDRSGRMRIWDITPVLDNLQPDGTLARSNLPDSPVCQLIMAAGTPGEKCSPASVLFVDKLRPYYRGGPCRYVLAGLKQNHVIQLWDLAIGKAVQEFVLPQATETDAICTVDYQPQSGVIVIGHPTRNVIYFIQLSAPKYDVPQMTQAEYCRGIAEKNPIIPKPESTAFMSCIRELSYESRGQLRSLDVLAVPPYPGEKKSNNAAAHGGDDKAGKSGSDGANLQPVFEIYTMYNRGVNCITITKDDLGLGPDDRVIAPINAAEKGFLEYREMAAITATPSEPPASSSASPDSSAQAASITPPAKKAADSAELPVIAEPAQARTVSPIKQSASRKKGGSDAGAVTAAAIASTAATLTPTSSHGEKEAGGRRRRKKSSTSSGAEQSADQAAAKQTAPASSSAVPAGAVAAASITSAAAGAGKAPTAKDQSPLTAVNFGVPSELLNREVKRMEDLVTGELSKSLKTELDSMYAKFLKDRVAQDKASIAKQDAVLQAVSRTLSENWEQNLVRIVETALRNQVVPKLTDTTTRLIERKIQETVEAALPAAFNNSPGFVAALASRVTSGLSKSFDAAVTRAMQVTLLPALRAEITTATTGAAKQTDAKMAAATAAVKALETQRAADAKKIDELTALVRSLSETVTLMAQSQARFQGEVLQLREQLKVDARAASASLSATTTMTATSPAPAHTSVPAPTPVPAPAPTAPAAPAISPEDQEVREIDQLMQSGEYEQGSIRWLQSAQQARVFDRLFVNYSAAYLSSLSPIVALSVGTAVTSSFATNVMQRLDWLQAAFKTIDPKDPDIRDVVRRIMDTIIERLDGLRLQTQKRAPNDPVLRRIPPLVMWAKDLRKAA
ncbi:hypothetical protein KEM52_004548 [Ascosphaera acerosa]|nr:hypothetical protein KEM52_004548 [Ascosphaera acerosa]